ncbi:hypothetical protein J5N97_029724 [Dioscorea zingiberensis]|uniref:RanBP2-type domain-containing protein n=1 Tax=Dioscorea zingiberensis TaxID=325984 RepID=A0A9D5BW84_9LILI|nr:hypothetical protein J5N97_029724 [Dioscorea zingiberensis]
MASTKLDNRGSVGSKRSRNNTSRGDGDWTCPQCGNVNFSYRTVCNRGQCGAARPSTSPTMRSTPSHSAFDHPPPFYFGGVGAPPPLPLGMSGGYGAPFSLSGMHYDYGPRGSAPGPYGLLAAYGPPGPMGGMGYGHVPGMERYGYGFQGSPLPIPGPWSGRELPDNNASRKRRGGPDGFQQGDWICPKCSNVNFSFRDTCNMKKCGTPRPMSVSNSGSSGNRDNAPEGSWTCDKCGNINYPFRTNVFDGMGERSAASWTAMSLGYARAGHRAAAMELFLGMPEKDVPAFNAMIDVFVKSGELDSARRLFDEMPERNVVTWTSLLFGYCKVGDMEAAKGLFDVMKEKNLFSWNVMISGYCQNRQPHQALDLFRELQFDSCPFEPDKVTLVSIIPAIADMGALELGRWIHKYVRKKGLEFMDSVSTALVDMYAKCGDVDEAKRVFDGIPQRTPAAWNAMIYGLAVNGRAKEALDVFTKMLSSGQCPNKVTMMAVLSACNHGGLVEEGRRWFREMEVYGVEPKVEHYGCMVDLLGRRGYLTEAERLVEEMPFPANEIILTSLLSACVSFEDVHMAEKLMKRLSKVESSDGGNYVMLRNLYAGEKRWGDVERVKEMMRKYGGKKEAGCSVIEVGSRVLEFVSGDKMHPDREVMFNLLRDLHLQMKDSEEDIHGFEMRVFCKDTCMNPLVVV